MGNFEKLSVVVIVVIIVMILAVAVVEWTSGGSSEPQQTAESAPESVKSEPPKETAKERKDTSGPKMARDERPSNPFESWDKEFPVDPKKERKPGDKDAKDPKDSAKGKEEAGPEGGPKSEKPAAPAPADVAETTHVVASGDTLGGISKKYYGKVSLWKVIQDANPGVTPETLRAGEKLKIPAMKGVVLAPAAVPAGGVETASTNGATSGVKPMPGKEYTIRANDTWQKIALAAYNSADRWPEIYVKNISRVRDQKDLTPGHTILIPR